MLDVFLKEYLIAAIVAGVPLIGFLLKWMIELLFSLFSKSITKAFEGITQRLDTLETLVRDLIKNQGESIAYHNMNSAEIERVRERVHTLENVVTVLKTSCEMCVIRSKKESHE